MQSAEMGNPVYDEKVNGILKGLAEGKTREQLAEQLGYANYRSLDMYMKRKHFTWNSNRNNYFPNKGKKQENDSVLYHQSEGRVSSIVSLLKRGIEPREIAKQLKFSDHREMAKYMRVKGYEWNDDQGTYVFKASSNVVIEMPSSPSEPRESKSQPEVITGGKSLEHYIPILQILESNHHKLLQLLETQESDSGVIPRYVMPGVHVTKSVHMVYGLDQLVREFSREKNISQREIFEVALVHFFKSYGYEQEINTLIGV